MRTCRERTATDIPLQYNRTIIYMELQNIRRTECNHPVENGSHDRGDWPGFLPMRTRSYKIQNRERPSNTDISP